MTKIKTSYQPSDKLLSDLAMSAIETTLATLPERERIEIIREVSYTSSHTRNLGEKGALELIGKLGMFLAKHEAKGKHKAMGY